MRAILVWVVGGWLCLLGTAIAKPAVEPPKPPPSTLPSRPAFPGEEIALKTRDGWALAARYEPAREGQLTFILLHQSGGRKEEWAPLARAMARRGIGLLALDLRGHGGSQNPPVGGPSHWRKFRMERKGYNEWSNMILDVEAAVAHLVEQGVEEASIALGGSDVGGSIALRYAALHRSVPMVFLLSPGLSYREVTTLNAMRIYTQRPILMVVGADDRRSVTETGLLFDFAKQSAGSERASLISVDREHGARMLAVNKELIAGILDWIENPIHPAELLEISTQAAPSPAEDLETQAGTHEH